MYQDQVLYKIAVRKKRISCRITFLQTVKMFQKMSEKIDPGRLNYKETRINKDKR